MDREGGNKENMRKCREWISLHFLILSPFPLYFLNLSPFFRSRAARLPQVVQPWLTLKYKYLLMTTFCLGVTQHDVQPFLSSASRHDSQFQTNLLQPVSYYQHITNAKSVYELSWQHWGEQNCVIHELSVVTIWEHLSTLRNQLWIKLPFVDQFVRRDNEGEYLVPEETGWTKQFLIKSDIVADTD